MILRQWRVYGEFQGSPGGQPSLWERVSQEEERVALGFQDVRGVLKAWADAIELHLNMWDEGRLEGHVIRQLPRETAIAYGWITARAPGFTWKEVEDGLMAVNAAITLCDLLWSDTDW